MRRKDADARCSGRDRRRRDRQCFSLNRAKENVHDEDPFKNSLESLPTVE